MAQKLHIEMDDVMTQSLQSIAVCHGLRTGMAMLSSAGTCRTTNFIGTVEAVDIYQARKLSS